MNCFIYRDGQQAGPFTEAALRAKITAGQLGRTDHVWQEGMADWRPAGETLAALFLPADIAASPHPAPPPVETDAWWVVRDGQEYGPYTRALLRQYLASGNLTAADQVRNDAGRELRRLDSLLSHASIGTDGADGTAIGAHGPVGSIDFNKIAAQIVAMVRAFGLAVAELIARLVQNAGPFGVQLREKMRGKEKIVGAGATAFLLLLAVWLFSAGAPSEGAMEGVIEKIMKEQLDGGKAIGIEIKLLKFKKNWCKTAEKGGYYCNADFEFRITGPLGSKTIDGNETNRYYKTSNGWVAVKD